MKWKDVAGWNDLLAWSDGTHWDDSVYWDDSVIWSDDDTATTVTGASVTVEKRMAQKTGITDMIRAITPVAVPYYRGITTDNEIESIIPDYVYLDKAIIVNTTANAAQLSAGTTSGGFDLFASQTIAASGVTVVALNKYITTTSSVFIHAGGGGDTWNSASIDIYLITWKL